ncbi:hypothetical protein C4X99_16815 [Leptospira interrogans serovar Geyaweera]|nr:hypothetical protein C4X99_16815 [Leptospira interrogans serovar Geyaweera]
MTEDKTIISAIVRAWKIGFPMFFPKSGTVESVNKTMKTLKVKIKDDFISDVTWTEPVVPMVGSKCLLVARENLSERYTAFAFEKIDSIKTKVADQVEIEFSEFKAFVNYKNLIKVTIDETGLTLDLGVNKLKIKGDIDQEGNFKTSGKIDAKQEITAFAQTPASVGLSTHLTDYTDTPVGPSVTFKPKAGT